jgi:hypothetical protein
MRTAQSEIHRWMRWLLASPGQKSFDRIDFPALMPVLAGASLSVVTLIGDSIRRPVAAGDGTEVSAEPRA